MKRLGTETNEAGEIVEVERQVVKYYTTEKLAGYAEYRYVTDAKIYIYPIVAFNDKVDGKASIYGYNKEADEYKLIATGSYTYSEATKLYTLVIEERFEEDVLTDAFDVTKVASFEFSVNEKLATTPFFFVYDTTPVEGEAEADPLTKVYTSAKGGTLTIVAGLIEYSEEGKYWVSTYKADGNIILANNVYFEIDEEALTFITLNPTPYVAYALSEDGNGNPDEYLYFDGKGGAFYTTVGRNLIIDAKYFELLSVGTYTFKAVSSASAYEFTVTVTAVPQTVLQDLMLQKGCNAVIYLGGVKVETVTLNGKPLTPQQYTIYNLTLTIGADLLTKNINTVVINGTHTVTVTVE